jgi:hypothetical protein
MLLLEKPPYLETLAINQLITIGNLMLLLKTTP